MLGRRGFALESATARVCREAGGRVTTNVMVRDLDLDDPRAEDGRRLEVVVGGLPLFGGCQLAVDATVVSALHCDGSPTQRSREHGWGGLAKSSPQVGPRRRARLVVLGVEIGGRKAKRRASLLRHVWFECSKFCFNECLGVNVGRGKEGVLLLQEFEVVRTLQCVEILLGISARHFFKP